MQAQAVFFWIFAAALVASALAVVSARNPVHSVLFLILAFVDAAGLFLLMGAEFLGMILVVVYVGAVAVLFLFVVMMLDIDLEEMRKGFWKSLWVAIPVGFAIIFELSAVIMRSFWSLDAQAPAARGNIGGTRELGQVLYTQYTYPFEIAGSILLVAIVAAVALTLRKRKDVKYFAPGDAVKVKAKDRMRIVHMKAESARAGGDAQSAAPSAENK